MRILDTSIVEGNSGTSNAVFMVRMSWAYSSTVTVNFASANGTAVAPGDYTAVSGSLSFPPGTTEQTISVPVAGDLLMEGDEVFFMTLGGMNVGVIADGLGVATIVEDDLPTLSVSDSAVTEGNTGAQEAVFTVTLSEPVGYPVLVSYGASAGTAAAGVDFGAAGGRITFPAGATTRQAAVPVFGDWIAEGTETFTLDLSAPSGATLADAQGSGTITDDDVPGLTISDVAVRERVGATATVTFAVTNAPPSGGGVTVDWMTADGTATAGSDYQAGSGTLVFDFGMSSQTLDVTVHADALVEGMETFVVNLSGAVGAPIAHGTATAKILDPAAGDFNGDTRTDLAWRHDVSGENVLWYMDGVTLLGGTFTTPAALADTAWKIVGTNDFNQDGKPDLLWRHQVSGENVLWYMDGSVLTSGTFLTPSSLADMNWGVSGTGDFNLDGWPDILWRHAVSGEMVVWYMQMSVLQGGSFLTPSVSPELDWHAVGTGDFNLDGHTDILWRNVNSGQNSVGFMRGSSVVSGAFLNPPAVHVSLSMVATGDYNNDGKVDIVWRQPVTGENVIWFMDGINLASYGATTTLNDANWRIVGPR